MKSKLLFSFLLGFNFLFSQFTVSDINGNPFTNGQIVTFTTHSTSSAELKFVVNNNSTQNLDFRIRCMNLVNATGTNFQLCWGYECIPDVSQGGVYPNFQYVINGGANTVGLGDSFKNFNSGDGINYPADYSFRFLTYDLSGNIVGSNFNLTYRYEGPLSIDQRDKLSVIGVKVLNTRINDFLHLQISNPINYEAFNLQGQLLLKGELESDTSLDMLGLSSGVYLINFSNKEGLNDSVKIYKN